MGRSATLNQNGTSHLAPQAKGPLRRAVQRGLLSPNMETVATATGLRCRSVENRVAESPLATEYSTLHEAIPLLESVTENMHDADDSRKWIISSGGGR